MTVSIISIAIAFILIPSLIFFFSTIRPQELASKTYILTFISTLIIVGFWVLLGWGLAFGEQNLFGIFSDPASSFILNFSYNTPGQTFSAIEGMNATVDISKVCYELLFPILGCIIIGGLMDKHLRTFAWGLFVLLWSIFYYVPISHMLWGKEGLLNANGIISSLLGTYTIDFSGALPLFVGSSVSSIVLSIVVRDSKMTMRARKKKALLGYLKDETIDVVSIPSIITSSVGQDNGIKTHAIIDTEKVGHIVHNKQRQVLSLFAVFLTFFGFLVFFLAGIKNINSNSAGIVWINSLVIISFCVFTWFIIEKILVSTITETGLILSVITGIGASAALADSLSPGFSILVGILSAIISFSGSILFNKLFKNINYISYISAFFWGGVSGSSLLGIFSNFGIINGNFTQIISQLIGIGITILLSTVFTFLAAIIADKLIGLRDE